MAYEHLNVTINMLTLALAAIGVIFIIMKKKI
jgi:hypothetical protein